MLCNIQEKLLLSSGSEIWNVSIEIYKLLLKLPINEMAAFILDSLHILKTRIGIETLEANQLLGLKKIVKGCINDCIGCMCSNNKANTVPYRYISEYKDTTVSEVYIAIMKNSIFNVINIGLPLNQSMESKGKYIAKFIKYVYKSFQNQHTLILSGSSLILRFFISQKIPVSRILHRDIIKLIKQPDFLKLFDANIKVFNTWKKILNIISSCFYKHQKNKLLEIILDTIEPNIISRFFGNYNFEEHSIALLAFIILVEDFIEDKGTLIDISNILFNTFNSIHLFKASCLVLKALYLKTGLADFNEIVSRILPGLFSTLMNIAAGGSNQINFFAFLKLLEFFRVTENELFFMFEGSLLYSISQNQINLQDRMSILGLAELNIVNSSKTDIEVDNHELCNPSSYLPESSIDAAIQHTLSYSIYSKNMPELEKFPHHLQESIIFDLIN